MKNLTASLFILSIALQSCITHQAQFEGTPFEKQLSTKAQFDQIANYLQDSSYTTGMLVLQNGKAIYEYGDLEQISYLASCRKSVLSMLYGKHVMNGTIDLKETIGRLGISEEDGLLEQELKATVDDIINSRSGVFHVAANGGYDKGNFLERGSVEPGKYFVYNNWDFNVAGHILEQKTGKSVYEELQEQLAIPLGFQDWNIKNQKKSGKKKNSQYLAYHMYLSTRDMAKIGQLMLQKGEWNGQQLISSAWIEKTTTAVTPSSVVSERYGTPNSRVMAYGYMWWLVESYKDNPIYKGAYTASGYGGQFITVIPKLDMVIVHKTKLDLLTLGGIRYKDFGDVQYWEIVDRVVKAME
ncbi:MAG: serine hydrolase [Bacteroidota bacterium]